jgi:hypothetical protein
LTAFLKLGRHRLDRQAARQLSLDTLAARGDPKEIRRQLKELTRE